MSAGRTPTPHPLALAAAGLLALACTRVPAAPPRRPSVLLVTIDTLRADHVGCYGRGGAATPVLDDLAARGVRFATAVAHVPLTGPSHASILTGRTPLGHGLRDNGGFALPAEMGTVAEAFRAAGYRTAAFVSGFPLDRRFGFDRGFETYDDHLPRGGDPRRTPYVERTADRTTEAVLRWLEAIPAGSRARPFFLWVHYYDPHAPYEPPAELRARFPSSPYDGEIAFVDAQLGRLLRRLDERSPAVVLVTADHGEALGEHGEETHGLFVYDATLRVPWIMAGPGLPSGRVPAVVARGIDVAPTLLDYAGLPARGDMEGRSLQAAVEGGDQADAPAYAESLFPRLQYGWAPLHAWRTARFKLIEAPRPELYVLDADAGETRDRAREEPGRVAQMRRQLQAAMSRKTPGAARNVDPETAERLRALGYVEGGPAPVPAGAALRDPKDGVQLVVRVGRGMASARTEPAVAIRELTAVLAEDPGMLVARRTRAVAYAAAGQHAAAIADLRRLESEGRLSAEDAVVLGDNLRFAGRSAEAIRALERTARENPRFAQPWLSLAEVHVKDGKNVEAAAAYEHVLQLAPDHVEALGGLGDLALLEGRLDAAAARYRRILEVDPADSGALTKLGVVRMRTGRPADATALFRKAVEGEPTNGEALLYLAGALASNGRPAEALPFFARALQAGQRSSMTWNGLGLARLAVGDRWGAAAAFRESLHLDPRQPDIARTLAEMGGPR